MNDFNKDLFIAYLQGLSGLDGLLGVEGNEGYTVGYIM
jgi:hypothetical protein